MDVNPTIQYRVHPRLGVVRPKRRWKTPELIVGAEGITVPAVQRMPRLKRSGRPHPQNWVPAMIVTKKPPVKLPSAPTLEEVMSRVSEASASPAVPAFLQRWNGQALGTLKVKALEIF